jgi:proteasome lid subunit RPN8/RPN11
MPFFKKKRKKEKKKEEKEKIWKIKEECLKLIIESSKSIYPREFAGLLSAKNNVISEIVILPGTISGESHAIFQFHMAPIDYSIVGTVHSHPSYSSMASEADLHLFEKYGRIHIIIAMPFDERSWTAYNWKGEMINLEVVE